jgi:hypothetical protein
MKERDEKLSYFKIVFFILLVISTDLMNEKMNKEWQSFSFFVLF